MAVHAKDALRRACIAEVLNLLLAIATLEAIRAESLITRQYCQIFDLISTAAAAVCAIVADQRPITEKEKVGIGVE